MSFGFSLGDIVTIGTLVLDLRQDYESAPAEGAELANDLESLQSSLSEFRKDEGQNSLLNRCTKEKRLHLQGILKQVQGILRELQSIRERYLSIDRSWRVWDRINFPRVQIKALRARIHLQISLLNLFMTSLSSAALARIEEVLKDIVRPQEGGNGVNLRPRPDNDNSWSALLDGMERSGIEREVLSRYKVPIEQLVDALSEVDETTTELSMESESTIVSGDADPFRPRQAVVGPPTKGHLVSYLCPGAVMLQDRRAGAIKQRRSFSAVYAYKLKCQKCGFVSRQDEKPDDLTTLTNTPVIFQSRKDALKSTSLEYYYEIHAQNRGKKDGIYYRTQFFWKCHVPASRETPHYDGDYECVFCPLEITFKKIYTRIGLLEHIRAQHIQNPPSGELRDKFNCWIDERPALFGGKERRLRLLKFDILLPKAFEETETRFATVQMNQAGEKKKKRWLT